MTELEQRDQAAAERSNLRLLVIGRSNDEICGVRRHAEALTAVMAAAGAVVTTAWSQGAGSQASSLGALVREVRQRCHHGHPDALLVHYSVFAYSHRGIPISVPAFAWRMSRLGLPMVLFAHEFAYPWRRRSWRGAIQALTQRVAFLPLVASASAVIVTTDERVAVLRSRWWLPWRPVTVAPVFSNIAPTNASVAEVPGRVGVFSFGAEGLAVRVVVDAVARAAQVVPGAHLVLIGAPGPDSTAANAWRSAAQRAGCQLSFTGVGTENEISEQLRRTEVIVFADEGGPSSRKTSLAAALAHGKPVVAFEHDYGWPNLVAAGAIELVPPSAEAVAHAIVSLLVDRDRRSLLGQAALQFYETNLTPIHVTSLVRAALDDAIASASFNARGRVSGT